MSKIGGLKANRTRICGILNTTFQEVAPLLTQRPNVSRATSEQLEELQRLVMDLLAQLQPDLQNLERANEKLEEEYVRTKDVDKKPFIRCWLQIFIILPILRSQ